MRQDAAPGRRSSFRRRQLLGAAALLLCCLAGSAGAQQQRQPDSSDSDKGSLDSIDTLRAIRPAAIHVDLAELGTGAHACDVTRVIRALCDTHAQCAIEVGKDLCPNRLLPGMIQPLKVTYRCRLGEMPREATAEEAHQLRILCDKSRGRPG